MALATRLIVQILITLLPLLGSAAPMCRSLFDPKIPGVPPKIEALADEARKTKSANAELNARVNEAILERFKALGLKYQLLPEALGKPGAYSYQILPDGKTDYGRLAQLLQKEHDALFVVSAEHYIREHYLGAVTDRRIVAPGSRPLFFLGLEEIYRHPRALRSPTVLHELRHLSIVKALSKLKDSHFYGKMEALDGLLPGFAKYQDSSYAKLMSFDEVRTFHTTLRMGLIGLKKVLGTGHRSEVSEHIQEVRTYFGMLKEITESADRAYDEMINIVETKSIDIDFKGSLGLTTAIFESVQVGRSRFRAEVPLVDADYFATIPSQKIEILRGTLYEMKSVTDALKQEVAEVDLILGPIFENGSMVSNQSIYKLIELAIPHLALLPH